MADTTTKFFDELAALGHHPLLAGATGTLRFDLVDRGEVETWVLAVDDGDVAVSRAEIEATCRVRTSKKVFEGFATGRVNAMAAMLRGEMEYEGDTELLVRFQRILPGPPDSSRAPVPAARARSAR